MKKKILFHSNYSRAFTGFGKNAKNILRYLFNTNKYDIVEAANGLPFSSEETQKQPWKAYGTLPSQQKIEQLKAQDPNIERSLGYGAGMIDEIIKLEKPDIYIGVEDIWGFNGYWDKPWWDKINSIIWTTLDSLPILPDAINAAPKIKNYYVWASFAEKALKELGYDHVKTLRGSLDTTKFFKIPEQERAELRKSFKLEDSFLIGFVFRNQLRKSVPNLLDGFNLFRQKNPKLNTKLLLHTHWSEGWDIPRLLREKNIPNNLVCTTYFCAACGKFEIKPFNRQNIPCKYCGTPNSQCTTNVTAGVSDEQLNQIYNLMDVYCHPFTSGGQEIPIQEAKLTELITLVTNYSCGEDSCSEESGGMPLKWSEYREPGTQFIKASTEATDICDKLNVVYSMSAEERSEIGKKARSWVIENFSVEKIGAQLESIFDATPKTDYDFELKNEEYGFDYIINDKLSDEEFVIDIFDKVLHEKLDKNNTSFIDFFNQLKFGITKQQIKEHILNIARQKNQKNLKIELSDLLDKDDEGRRIAIVLPESAEDVFLVNSLLENLKSLYPESNIYFFTNPQYFELLLDNPNVHKCLAYDSSCDNLFLMEGIGDHNGFFEIAFLPSVTTQKHVSYVHNGKDKMQFSLK